MAFAKARMSPLVVLTWTAISIASLMPHQILCTYDQAQLSAYARLSQQLRQEMIPIMQATQTRIIALNTFLSQRTTELHIRLQYWDAFREHFLAMDSLLTVVDRNAAHVVTVFPDEQYQDRFACPLTRTSNDYGMGWLGDECRLNVKKGGVYAMEVHLQTTDYGGYAIDLQILDANGVEKSTYTFSATWEVTPEFRLVNVEPGDFVVVKPWDDANYNFVSTASMRKGFRTRLTMRYLGIFDLPEFTTTEAPGSTEGVGFANPFPMPMPMPMPLG